MAKRNRPLQGVVGTLKVCKVFGLRESNGNINDIYTVKAFAILDADGRDIIDGWCLIHSGCYIYNVFKDFYLDEEEAIADLNRARELAGVAV